VITYSSAVEQLLTLGHELAAGSPRKFELEHMRVLAEAMGNPQRRFACVLVAGTNGKGSTSATLAAILENAGHRTGLYTSPHLIRVNERMRINGEAISDVEFAEIYWRVNTTAAKLVTEGKLPHHPSFFEMLTAMAFEYFASAGVEIAVLEVGMGGRLDATNIVDPCVSIITDVALDHQQYLGNTITEIAREKAGILRKNGILVTLPQHPEANDAIGKAAMEVGTRAISAAQYVPNTSPGSAKFDQLAPTAQQIGAFLRLRYFLEVMGEELFIETPLIGRHQVRNVALAIAAAEQISKECGFAVTAQEIAAGIRDTRWPARFQFIPHNVTTGVPDVIIDVAHNPAGAWALRSALSENFTDRPLTIVFGGMKDKALGEMAEILFPMAEHVILTNAHTSRAATPEAIKAATPVAADAVDAVDVPAALERARNITPKEGVIVVTGSIYLAGEALKALGIRV
jgi:dihydrofolate synthase/folylpolyglutamate synthase